MNVMESQLFKNLAKKGESSVLNSESILLSKLNDRRSTKTKIEMVVKTLYFIIHDGKIYTTTIHPTQVYGNIDRFKLCHMPYMKETGTRNKIYNKLTATLSRDSLYLETPTEYYHITDNITSIEVCDNNTSIFKDTYTIDGIINVNKFLGDI